MKKDSSFNGIRITAIVLLFIVALNALAAGYSFIAEPSGKEIGISTDYLKEPGPFKDYLIPGIILFTVIGIWSIVVVIFAIRKSNHYPFLILTQGCILVGWIAIQLLLVTTFHPLHLIIGVTGITLIILGWLINRRRIACKSIPGSDCFEEI